MEQKKRILCLIDTIGMGGAERQMIGLAIFLKEKGYCVNLVTYYTHDFYSELVERYGLGCLTLHVGKSKWSKLMAVRKHIKEVGGYDWIIAYKGGPCQMSCLLKMIGGRFNLIVSQRSTTQSISRSIKLQFFLYRWADYVVPNSFSETNFIKRNFRKLANRTIAITNFTDTDHFVPQHANACTDKIVVMTAARVSYAKNILNYLKAIKILKDKGLADRVRFLWFGDIQSGEEEYGEQVLSLHKSLGLEDIIEFHPATPNILPHYQKCDVFCLPSAYEGFPNVICEAMSCGKPIVCSRVCDNPNIVKENANGYFFEPNDIEDIAEKLYYAICLPKHKLLEMGEESRRIAQRQFSKEAFVNKYIELIESK